jgi:hypothetical protein
MHVRITVKIIALASEKDITNVQRMRVTRSFLDDKSCQQSENMISLQEICKNFSGDLKIENSLLLANAKSQHRDISAGISSHSLMTKSIWSC